MKIPKIRVEKMRAGHLKRGDVTALDVLEYAKTDLEDGTVRADAVWIVLIDREGAKNATYMGNLSDVEAIGELELEKQNIVRRVFKEV